MTRNFCANIASNNRRRTTAQRLIAVAAIAVVGTAFMPVRSAAEDDLLQKAINYVFTGTVDPRTPPEIVDRQLCVVVTPDPRAKRFIRYYLTRFRLDDPSISSTYSGRQVSYQLDVESGKIVIEYLDLDKTTVNNAYKSAQIPLPGDIDETKKALRFIASRCKGGDATKLPF
jgi:hypothetical protein